MANYHSLSAPNLDLTEKTLPYHCSAGTSSSSQALKDIPANPAGPALPIAEPIRRRPTPEGLPPFGSKEAQELRLFPETSFMRRARAIAHWLRGDRVMSDDVLSERSPTITAAERGSSGSVGSTRDQERSVPMDMLQRIFGVPWMVETSEQSADPNPRVGLPRGVVATDSPGVLATAPDRTYVRGKFGVRMSAHGVGSRALTAHPLAYEHPEQKPVSRPTGPNMGSSDRGHTAALTQPTNEMQHSDPANPQLLAPLPAMLIARQAIEQDNRPRPVPVSIGYPSMQEPQLYPPSPHDRTADGSRSSQGGSMQPAQVGRSGSTSDVGRRRQQQPSEKSEGGCCHGCCDPPLPPRQRSSWQDRETRGSTAGTSHLPNAALMASLAATSAATASSAAACGAPSSGAGGGVHSCGGGASCPAGGF